MKYFFHNTPMYFIIRKCSNLKLYDAMNMYIWGMYLCIICMCVYGPHDLVHNDIFLTKDFNI